jgi:2-keto-4-pentenoate hydratase/2-oxohepta-3-ene-1,7-dioic acid hydratase in catechol pathway
MPASLHTPMFITLPGGPTLRPAKLLCVGRNYAAHVREMGDVSDLPTEPVVFLKPSTALIASGGAVVIPAMSEDVHHEVELVVVIGKQGRHILEEDALEHVAGYALGLDMTARDLQARAKAQRAAWAVAKGFDTFAPLGPLAPAEHVRDPHDLEIKLRVNGEVRQRGYTRDFIFGIPFLIAYLSRVFTLEPGDLIFTGTPEGVGPVRPGDVLEANASGAGGRLDPLRVTVAAEG